VQHGADVANTQLQSSHLFRGRPLRVLHGTYEIAGQGMMLARALRETGVEADSLAYRVDWDGRQPSLVVDLDRHRTPVGRMWSMSTSFLRWAARYDLFHFHFGTSFFYVAPRERPQLLRGHWDLPALKAMGKRIVFHFHGCEIRDRERMISSHALATCTECDPFCRPWHQQWLRGQAARFADRVFFSTLDLSESAPGAVHLPLAMEVERWSRAGDAYPLPDFDRRDGVNGPVVIAHAPTNRLIKGTRHVEAAVAELRAEGLKVELRLIEKRPWETMPEFLSGADILVDQLMMGWYGLLAMEGMAEGRAVVAHLRVNFAGRLEGCPVVNATPDTVTDVLRDLVRNPARRAMLGAAGRRYVAQKHDLRVVGAQLLAEYREVLDPSAPGPAGGEAGPVGARQGSSPA
jgi:glycosyltransferase involved in cell wall biosynthesis